MTPEKAGELCDRLDKCLRGADLNLGGVADLIVVIIRDEVWRRRKIRTGEIVECESFLELLTAPPLRGYGEDPRKVEALLRDDADALRMFREATTQGRGGDNKSEKAKINSDNITIDKPPERGTSRAYTLDRLHRKAPELYQEVVAKKLSVNQAAIKAGFRKIKTPLQQLEYWYSKASPSERRAFGRWIKGRLLCPNPRHQNPNPRRTSAPTGARS